jgi:spore maturation protein A
LDLVNKIWLLLFIIGISFALFNGRIEAVHQAIFSSPKAGLLLLFNLSGMYILWSGLLEIVKDTKLIDVFARKIYFITRFLFPELPKDHPVHGYIASNMASNMLGLGSVSTPLGIKAMEEMKKLNGNKDTASRSMITLIVMNASCLTLIPTTLISLREVNGSVDSVRILPFVVLTTALSTITALLLDRLLYRIHKKEFE